MQKMGPHSVNFVGAEGKKQNSYGWALVRGIGYGMRFAVEGV